MVSFSALALSGSVLLASLVSAAPASTELYHGRKFHLKVKNSSNAKLHLDGTYLTTYHTGAALADAVFTTRRSEAAVVFLNHTNFQFDLPGLDYPFSLSAPEGYSNYARWAPTGIEAGYGGGGFRLDATKGVVGVKDGIAAGWVVCQWSHGKNVPQLFVAVRGSEGKVDSKGLVGLPDTCANVRLLPEYV